MAHPAGRPLTIAFSVRGHFTSHIHRGAAFGLERGIYHDPSCFHKTRGRRNCCGNCRFRHGETRWQCRQGGTGTLQVGADAAHGMEQFENLGLEGECKVRDLWVKSDMGDFKGDFSAMIPCHGAGLYRITPK